jgi:hypothetical protein
MSAQGGPHAGPFTLPTTGAARHGRLPDLHHSSLRFQKVHATLGLRAGVRTLPGGPGGVPPGRSGDRGAGKEGQATASTAKSDAGRGLRAARPRAGGGCIINTPMGQELSAELNSFEVDFTSAGNMRVDVRSKDHHGDLVIATALALWSAVGRPWGRIEVGRLELLVMPYAQPPSANRQPRDGGIIRFSARRISPPPKALRTNPARTDQCRARGT